MKYKVHWQELWKRLTVYMSVAIAIPVSFVFVARFFATGMDIDKTFEHITLPQLPLIYVGIVLLSAIFAFLVSLAFKLATITIENDTISGRNYWFLKNTIPLSKITELDTFSSNGIEAIVANGGIYGKVYISTYTENLDDLLDVLDSYMEDSNA